MKKLAHIHMVFSCAMNFKEQFFKSRKLSLIINAFVFCSLFSMSASNFLPIKPP